MAPCSNPLAWHCEMRHKLSLTFEGWSTLKLERSLYSMKSYLKLQCRHSSLALFFSWLSLSQSECCDIILARLFFKNSLSFNLEYLSYISEAPGVFKISTFCLTSNSCISLLWICGSSSKKRWRNDPKCHRLYITTLMKQLFSPLLFWIPLSSISASCSEFGT